MQISREFSPRIQEIDSPAFAAQLRLGPIRSILDRVVRSAAEAANMPYMVLGLRYGDHYEFISTHGIPLAHYTDRVPAKQLATKLFAREVEVADLQKQAQFSALSIAPVAKTWRYGGNAPVRLNQMLGDGGVLALSCADTSRRETGGKILGLLRGHAEFIADLIWLSRQIRKSDLATDPVLVVKAVLQAAIAQVKLPVCIMDEARHIVGVSETFAAAAREIGESRLRIGEKISADWLTPAIESQVAEALSTQMSRQWIDIEQTSANRYLLDVFPFSFPDLGRFTLFSLHNGINIGLATNLTTTPPSVPNSASVRDSAVAAFNGLGPAGDGTGPVSRFLFDTLIRTQRLNRRNQTSYVGVRRWRSAIKPHQISALRALKGELPDAFVEAVVTELVEAVRAVYGIPESCVVVPVPCGHSGPGCLSVRLARGLAERIGVPMVPAIAMPAPPSGASHPRKNATRPAMRLVERIEQPVILVDDVATSGSHLDEAASLLRKTSTCVWSIAWITG